MKLMLFSVLTFFLLLSVFFLPVRDSSIPDNNIVSVEQPSAKDNFNKFCAGCHGMRMERFAGRTWEAYSAGDDLSQVIRYGLPALGMPSFEKALTNAEMQAMSKYILTEIRERVEVPKPTKFPKVIKSDHLSFRIDTIVKGLDVPWGVAFLPEGDLLVAERSGELFRFGNTGILKASITGIPEVYAQGQGGLLDIVLHPKYKTNGWIYISYSKLGEDGRGANTAIIRAKLKNNVLVEQQEIFKATPDAKGGVHFGGRMVFDDEGYLFFSTGERGDKSNSQKLGNHSGKVHRIFDDGRIPPDNPFVNTPEAMPTIYSYGHRNPQGIDIHPVSRRIYVNEHGPRGGDEINLIDKGLNYGWPVITYGINYDGTIITKDTVKAGMEQPVYFWRPSIGPSCLKFVTGDRYPAWKGDVLNGSLSFRNFERIKLVDGKVAEREKLLEGAGRVRHIVMSPDGFIYVAVESPGVIVKLVPVQ
jgi:aldose sugar dehydrogenase